MSSNMPKTFKQNVSTCVLPLSNCHNCRINHVSLDHKDWVLPPYLLHDLESKKRVSATKTTPSIFFSLVITSGFQGSHRFLYPLYLTNYVLTISLYVNMYTHNLESWSENLVPIQCSRIWKKKKKIAYYVIFLSDSLKLV